MWLRKKSKSSCFSSLSNYSTFHCIANSKITPSKEKSFGTFKKVTQFTNRLQNKFQKKQPTDKLKSIKDYYKIDLAKPFTALGNKKFRSTSPEVNVKNSEKRFRRDKEYLVKDEKIKDLKETVHLYYSKETNDPKIETDIVKKVDENFLKTENKQETKETVKQNNYGFQNISTIHKVKAKGKKSSIILNKNKRKLKKQKKEKKEKQGIQLNIKMGKRKKNHHFAQTIEQKIKIHLQIIKELGQYSEELIQLYEEVQIWEELAFLVYKQFYKERIKVVSFLRKKGKNPFILSASPITNSEVQNFRKRLQLVKTVRSIENSNKTIQDSLQTFYKELVMKSDEFRILSNDEYCTKKMFSLFEQEINALKQLISENDEDAKERLATVYRCLFLILQLRGKPILTYEEYLKYDQQGNYLQKAQHCFLKNII